MEMWKGREDVATDQNPHFWFPSQRLLPRTMLYHVHTFTKGWKEDGPRKTKPY